VSDASGTPGKSSYPSFNVRRSDFVRQLELILASGLPVVSLDDVAAGRVHGTFAVSLTFDDGYVSDLEIVCPLLKTLRFPAAFFPVVHGIGAEGRLSWAQLRELAANGFTIGSHGLSHTLLTELNRAQQGEELKSSKRLLEEHLSQRVDYFSLPYGWYSDGILSQAREAGYRFVLSTRMKMNHPSERPFVLHRVNVKRDLPFEKFKRLLLSEGVLPLSENISASAKALVKRALGPSLSGRLSLLIHKIVS
jgi:peptidoglycan/xylan/chitin deacetylase (PgdA/CDA1 family)